jgi:predicted short-subunit dehydrogenase-like oxidoreductase (DUF2520 family)
MKVAWVGAGNVAWHLAQAFDEAGVKVVEVYSRNFLHAESLCQHLYEAEPKRDLDFLDSKADLLLISVSDDALAEVIDNLILRPDMLVAHTSGSISMKVFEGYPYPYGVFYPLQTFSKKRNLDVSKVPFCIEGQNDKVVHQLTQLARKISKAVYQISSEERKILHISAVFACNFVNHLLALSKDILDGEKLDFAILKPLIQETIQKALDSKSPLDVQTGPAVRRDFQVIEQHLHYLEQEPLKKKIYEILTESILQTQE